jgi:hypothetical protein
MEITWNIIASILATGLFLAAVRDVFDRYHRKTVEGRKRRESKGLLITMENLVLVERAIHDSVKASNRSAEAYREKTEQYFLAYNSMAEEQRKRLEFVCSLIKGAAQGFLTTEEVVAKIVAARILPEDQVIAGETDVDA